MKLALNLEGKAEQVFQDLASNFDETPDQVVLDALAVYHILTMRKKKGSKIGILNNDVFDEITTEMLDSLD